MAPAEERVMFFGMLVRRSKIRTMRDIEYRRGYNYGHAQGVDVGHSEQWRGMLEHMRGYTQIVELKDRQIELLQNKIVSLQSIITMLEDDYYHDDLDYEQNQGDHDE
jgi:hypothetical protein